MEFPLRRVFLFLRLRFLVYPLSHLHASATFKPFTLACTTEDETREFHDVWFAVVSNHPFYGGGMKAAPLANPREKTFDIVIVENQPFLKNIGFYVSWHLENIQRWMALRCLKRRTLHFTRRTKSRSMLTEKSWALPRFVWHLVLHP